MWQNVFLGFNQVHTSLNCAENEVIPSCYRLVKRDIYRLLRRQAGIVRCRRLWRYGEIAAERAAEDLVALARRDPAAGGSWGYVAESYASYQAIIAYRLAHVLLPADCAPGEGGRRDDAALARSISEDAKVRTGIEIHPAADIGRRFILDHAVGTVIGETTAIGNDCYVLQGVIMGASGIAGNATGKRHPTLGDRVEIGAFARLLGPITIGNDAWIGPHAVVVTDIPARSHVYLMNQCQIRSPRAAIKIFGVVPARADVLEIHGVGLADADVQIADASDQVLDGFTVRVVGREANRLACQVDAAAVLPAGAVLRIMEPGGERILVTQLAQVWSTIRNTEAGLRVPGG